MKNSISFVRNQPKLALLYQTSHFKINQTKLLLLSQRKLCKFQKAKLSWGKEVLTQALQSKIISNKWARSLTETRIIQASLISKIFIRIDLHGYYTKDNLKDIQNKMERLLQQRHLVSILFCLKMDLEFQEKTSNKQCFRDMQVFKIRVIPLICLFKIHL